MRRLLCTIFGALSLLTAPAAPVLALDQDDDDDDDEVLAARVASLEADLAALLDLITFAPDGSVTIAAAGDLLLDAGVGRQITICNDATLQGNTMMEGDAAVMGIACLENDVMMMQDAMVMGDAVLESKTEIAGTLRVPQNTATVNASGELILDIGALSSSIDVVAAADSLKFIPPAAQEGTFIDLRNGQVADALGVQANPFVGNIVLRKGAGDYKMAPADTLTLRSIGDSWIEVSRSSGHIEVFSVESDTVEVLPGQTEKATLDCVFGPEGRDTAILLVSSVVLDDALTVLEIDRQNTVRVPGPLGGVERVIVTVRNTGLLSGTFTINCRCLDP